MSEWSIDRKELLLIVMATMLWGREWNDLSVLAHCDNGRWLKL